MIFSQCCNYIYRLFFGGDPSSSDTCYVFEFDMIDPADRIDSITYNDGTQNITTSIPLDSSVSEVEIADAIKTALGAADPAITYEDVTVSRVDIGGNLFSYTITFKNTSVTIDIIDVSGNSTASTTTDCT